MEDQGHQTVRIQASYVLLFPEVLAGAMWRKQIIFFSKCNAEHHRGRYKCLTKLIIILAVSPAS